MRIFHTLSILLLLFCFHYWSCTSATGNPAARTSPDQLGRLLFFDASLSYNNTKSCASCHNPSFAFSDGYRKSITAGGDIVRHNAPSLINSRMQSYLNWADTSVKDHFQQSYGPLFNQHPTELGALHHEQEILSRLVNDSKYSRMFAEFFPNEKAAVNFDNIRKALAAFTNTLVSTNSPYDRFMSGDSFALSSSAKAGKALFFSKELACASCHGGLLFTNATITKNIDSIYFNTGLYNLRNRNAYTINDRGLQEITGRSEDNGRFRVASLRNLAFTAPYLHDGSVATLNELIDIYAAGGRVIANSPLQGDGRLHANKHPLIKGFKIDPVQKRQLIDFLFSLTDSSILVNPAFLDPAAISLN